MKQLKRFSIDYDEYETYTCSEICQLFNEAGITLRTPESASIRLNDLELEKPYVLEEDDEWAEAVLGYYNLGLSGGGNYMLITKDPEDPDPMVYHMDTEDPDVVVSGGMFFSDFLDMVFEENDFFNALTAKGYPIKVEDFTREDLDELKDLAQTGSRRGAYHIVALAAGSAETRGRAIRGILAHLEEDIPLSTAEYKLVINTIRDLKLKGQLTMINRAEILDERCRAILEQQSTDLNNEIETKPTVGLLQKRIALHEEQGNKDAVFADMRKIINIAAKASVKQYYMAVTARMLIEANNYTEAAGWMEKLLKEQKETGQTYVNPNDWLKLFLFYLQEGKTDRLLDAVKALMDLGKSQLMQDIDVPWYEVEYKEFLTGLSTDKRFAPVKQELRSAIGFEHDSFSLLENLTAQEYWDKLMETGWFEGLPKEHTETRRALTFQKFEQGKQGDALVHLVTYRSLDSEFIDYSYTSILKELQEASFNLFSPRNIKEEIDVENDKLTLSYRFKGKYYRIELRGGYSYGNSRAVDCNVFHIVNHSLMEGGSNRVFVQVLLGRGSDIPYVSYSLAFTTREAYARAQNALILPPDERTDANPFFDKKEEV